MSNPRAHRGRRALAARVTSTRACAIPALRLLPALFLFGAAPRVAAGARAPLEITMNARVVDATGWPIERARVIVDGPRKVNALTGPDGRCVLRVPLRPLRELPERATEVVVRAQARGEHLAFLDGSDALKLEIVVARRDAGGALVRVRSNSAVAAAAAAAAVREPEAPAPSFDASFIGTAGPAPALRADQLTATLEVEVSGLEAREVAPRNPTRSRSIARAESEKKSPAASPAVTSEFWGSVAAPAKPETTAAPPVKTPAREQSRKAEERSPPHPAESPRPSPPSRAAAEGSKPGANETGAAKSPPSLPTLVGGSVQTTRTLPRAISTPGEVPVLTPSAERARKSEGPCACRATGTVEVDWDRPLPRPLHVVVSAFDLPAARDTVRLFMGSPRSFVLQNVPCGYHRLVVQLLEREPFELATADAALLFNCERGPFKPLRVVLVRR